jgi:hypothetical protein
MNITFDLNIGATSVEFKMTNEELFWFNPLIVYAFS